MKTLQNVLKFIKSKKLSLRKLERILGLTNGRINYYKSGEIELPDEIIEKIVEKYSTELIAAGYSIVYLSTIGGKGKAIMSQEEKANFDNIIYDPQVPYQVNPPKIEIYTSSGKQSFNVANKDHIEVLNALLAEKEERQRETKQRAERAEEEKARLYLIIEQNLTTLLKITKVIDEKLG
jgi:putative ubiquitin-RnfH superfamily antitoxin RatB of RatAB toxin-antitoxin module